MKKIEDIIDKHIKHLIKDKQLAHMGIHSTVEITKPEVLYNDLYALMESELQLSQYQHKKLANMFDKEYESTKAVKYRRTKKGCLSYLYSGMANRIKENPRYKKIKLKMTRREFYDWARNRDDFVRVFDIWAKSKYDISLSPSVDRIDNKGDYEKPNIQIITLAENTGKSDKEVYVPLPNNYKLTIPNYIVEHRRILGMNKTEYGRKYGVTLTAVTLWERGVNKAPYPVLEDVISFKINAQRKRLKEVFGKKLQRVVKNEKKH